jgi:hypothetical protein
LILIFFDLILTPKIFILLPFKQNPNTKKHKMASFGTDAMFKQQQDSLHFKHDAIRTMADICLSGNSVIVFHCCGIGSPTMTSEQQSLLSDCDLTAFFKGCGFPDEGDSKITVRWGNLTRFINPSVVVDGSSGPLRACSCDQCISIMIPINIEDQDTIITSMMDYDLKPSSSICECGISVDFYRSLFGSTICDGCAHGAFTKSSVTSQALTMPPFTSFESGEIHPDEREHNERGRSERSGRSDRRFEHSRSRSRDAYREHRSERHERHRERYENDHRDQWRHRDQHQQHRRNDEFKTKSVKSGTVVLTSGKCNMCSMQDDSDERTVSFAERDYFPYVWLREHATSHMCQSCENASQHTCLECNESYYHLYPGMIPRPPKNHSEMICKTCKNNKH